jgi:hypothetical protein
MAAQSEKPVRVAKPAPEPLVPMGQTAPIKADCADIDRDDRPVRNESLLERFLQNLRIALSAPHA